MKRFADRLREARIAAGLTQEQLGFAVGVTKSSISAWENNRETPNFKLLPELRNTLGRSLDELVCGFRAGAQGQSDGTPDHNALAARDNDERALLQRYRALAPQRRAAVLELIKPASGS